MPARTARGLIVVRLRELSARRNDTITLGDLVNKVRDGNAHVETFARIGAEAASPWREDGEGCCQTKADKSRKSRRAPLCSQQLTPLGERFFSERFEAGPAFEGSVVVEVVVDGGVGSGELL